MMPDSILPEIQLFLPFIHPEMIIVMIQNFSHHLGSGKLG